MDAYRAPGGSSTLATLAQEGASTLPRQSTLLTPSQIAERLELAADVADDKGSLGLQALALLGGGIAVTVVGMMGLWLSSKYNARPLSGGEQGFLMVMFIGSIIAGIAAWSSSLKARQRRERGVAELLTWPRTLPFPTEAWREYLVTDRPLVEVALRTAPERRQFIDAVRAIDGAIGVERIDDHTFRLALPPRAKTFKTFSGKSSSRSVRFGDRKLFAHLVERLLVPLHQESGVAAVRFGGTIEVR